MAKALIIVESPAKTRTIRQFVGKDYEIEASLGHVRDLPKSKMGVDVENDFAPQYIALRDRSSVLKKLGAAVKKADRVFLATDPDREGWDVDDVALYFSGQDIDNRIIGGKIMNQHSELSDIEIRRQYNRTQITASTGADGSFMMPKNNVDRDYIFTAYHNENTIYGLTTLDLVLIQRHILGLDTFTHPLQYLAADVNNDKKVTASDLVHMRKIILGIDTHFKRNTSWLFLDEASMKTETNPWLIKRHIDVPSGRHDLDHLRFVALKVGDVDGVLQIVNKLKK